MDDRYFMRLGLNKLVARRLSGLGRLERGSSALSMALGGPDSDQILRAASPCQSLAVAGTKRRCPYPLGRERDLAGGAMAVGQLSGAMAFKALQPLDGHRFR